MTGRRLRAAGVLLAANATLLLTAFGAPSASADFGIEVFDGAVSDADGEAFTQAGGHPFEASTAFDLRLTTDDQGNLIPEGGRSLKNLRLDLPSGFIGNPTAVPTCSLDRLMAPDLNELCPASTVVGFALARLNQAGQVQTIPAAVHNLEAPPGVPARFGFVIFAGSFNVPTFLDASVGRDGDYRISVSARNLSQGRTILGSTVTLWGNPADEAHDDLRCSFYLGLPPQPCLGEPGTPIGPNPFPSELPVRAFLTNPGQCTEPGEGLTTTLRVESWGEPTLTDEASFESHLPPHYPEPPENWGPPQGPTGCENLPFEPAISLQPTSNAADSPTGLAVDLTFPQEGLTDPDGLATAHLKRAEVTLPEGMAISPSAANGLASCSPEEIGLRSSDPIRFDDADETCSDVSRIGTLEIETPLLDDPLEGSVYVAEQDRNPFRSTFALYLVAKGSGVIVKLPGEVSPDPATGRITATFDDNPELPFSSLKLRLKGGQRAPLVTPPTCGRYAIETEMSPWSAADPDNPTPAELVTDTDSFTIDRGPNGGACLAGDPNQPGDPRDLSQRPFDLGFTAGVRNPQAASRSPFTVRLGRPDGHQELERLDVELPQGVSASLRGVPLCSESDAANANCGPESQIGTVQAAAGAGSNPFWVTDGKVYLTGPYKGAPLGLSIGVPAVAGPFDLGEVAVRVAAFVDKRDAHITVRSDPIPQILEGVPLRVREMRIRIDRPDFTLAGTSCTESQVSAEANGVSGASTQLAERFQLSGCRGLGFKPKFRFKAIGKRSTPRLAHPRLRAVVRPKPRGGRNANISRTRVVLPRGVELDQANVARPCTRPQFTDDACPNRTKMGRAIARSPLLDDPLQGPVYLVTSDNELPDLVADLNGIVDIDLRGRIDTTKKTQRIRTTFEVVPDVPVRSFRLNLKGGRRQGLLINSTDRCDNRRQNRIKVGTKAHNGLRADQRPFMRVKCSKRGQKRK